MLDSLITNPDVFVMILASLLGANLDETPMRLDTVSKETTGISNLYRLFQIFIFESYIGFQIVFYCQIIENTVQQKSRN